MSTLTDFDSGAFYGCCIGSTTHKQSCHYSPSPFENWGHENLLKYSSTNDRCRHPDKKRTGIIGLWVLSVHEGWGLNEFFCKLCLKSLPACYAIQGWVDVLENYHVNKSHRKRLQMTVACSSLHLEFVYLFSLFWQKQVHWCLTFIYLSCKQGKGSNGTIKFFHHKESKQS